MKTELRHETAFRWKPYTNDSGRTVDHLHRGRIIIKKNDILVIDSIGMGGCFSMEEGYWCTMPRLSRRRKTTVFIREEELVNVQII